MPDNSTDREMEEALREFGAATRYPPTPDVSVSVRARLESEGNSVHRRRWFESPGIRVAAALVIVLILALPVVQLMRDGLSSGGESLSRSGSDGMSGAGGADVARSPLPDSSAELDRPDSNRPDSAGSSSREILGLRTEITPERARDISGGSIPRIRTNGATVRPDELYAAGRSIVAVFGEQSGLPQMGETGFGAVISFQPDRDTSEYLEGKVEGEDYRRVRVGDGSGYWFPDGGELRSGIGDTDGLPGGTLLWKSDDGLFILRSALPENQAIEVAETIR